MFLELYGSNLPHIAKEHGGLLFMCECFWNHMDQPCHILPKSTVVYCLCVNVSGIIWIKLATYCQRARWSTVYVGMFLELYGSNLPRIVKEHGGLLFMCECFWNYMDQTCHVLPKSTVVYCLCGMFLELYGSNLPRIAKEHGGLLFMCECFWNYMDQTCHILPKSTVFYCLCVNVSGIIWINLATYCQRARWSTVYV